jgi:hypothetical protein
MFVDPTAPGTNLGQIIIFLSFLLSTGIQLWKDRNARRDARELAAKVEADNQRARKEAAEREERIKKAAEEQHAKTRAQFEERMAQFKKRFNGLLEDDHD